MWYRISQQNKNFISNFNLIGKGVNYLKEHWQPIEDLRNQIKPFSRAVNQIYNDPNQYYPQYNNQGYQQNQGYSQNQRYQGYQQNQYPQNQYQQQRNQTQQYQYRPANTTNFKSSQELSNYLANIISQKKATKYWEAMDVASNEGVTINGMRLNQIPTLVQWYQTIKSQGK